MSGMVDLIEVTRPSLKSKGKWKIEERENPMCGNGFLYL